MTRVADTSVLYALFSDADRFHERAVKDVGDPDPIVVPTEVLVETIDLLTYRFGFHAGRRALEFLLELPHVGLAEKVEVAAVRAVYEAAKGRLSLADSFVVQTCLTLGTGALAYDRQIVGELRTRRPDPGHGTP